MLTKRMAYEKWLGIHEEHQPPSLYRLLGIEELESNKKAIADAAMRRVDAVRQLQAGDDSKLATEILNELLRAQIVLLNPQEKAAYDAKLRNGSWSNPANPTAPREAVPLAKPIPQARILESTTAKNVGPQANLDLNSLVSASTPGVGKLQAKPRRPANLIVAGVAVAVVLAGCAAAGLILLLANQQVSSSTDHGDLASDNRPKPSETSPRESEPSKDSTEHAAASSAKLAATGKTRDEDKTPSVAALPQTTPDRETVGPYDEARLAKEVEEIANLAQDVKTPDESQRVAQKAIVLLDRAIVLGNADAAKKVAVLGLAAARSAESIPLARQITVTFIQLQSPISEALVRLAKRRLASVDLIRPDEVAGEATPRGPSIDIHDDAAKLAETSVHHEARWGKTEDERRKIFYDLLKAVDDFGMTPEGRKAWKDILARNGIDARATLGILNEGFNTFSNWEQPGGSGTASSRMNRMHWIGQRTRSMSEPMLQD